MSRYKLNLYKFSPGRNVVRILPPLSPYEKLCWVREQSERKTCVVLDSMGPEAPKGKALQCDDLLVDLLDLDTQLYLTLMNSLAEGRRYTLPKKVAQRKWMFPSQSQEGKAYTVTQWDTGELTCNCPAWVFKKGDIRNCLHVAGVRVTLMGAGSPGLPTEVSIRQEVTVPVPVDVPRKKKRLISLED